jgi:hypothetical protein
MPAPRNAAAATRRMHLPFAFLLVCVAAVVSAGAARADYFSAWRFTFPEPAVQGENVQGPGAARGLWINPVPIDGPGAIGARPEGEVDPLEFISATVIENGTHCGQPEIKVNGNVTCEWSTDCAVPGDFMELCLRTNYPIFSLNAYWVDEVGDIIAPAIVTSLGVCGGIDCSNAVAVIESVWPPSHKLSPVSITGVTGVGDISIEVTGITSDEALSSRADGARPSESCPDGLVDLDGQAWVRMERSGLGNGRVYEVSFTATDETGSTCEGSVTVCVPHDLATACVDDGQTVVATETCDASPTQISLEGSAAVPALRVVASSARHAELEFSLPTSSRVEVGVFDVAGRRMASVENGVRAAGVHRVSWDAKGIAQGVYFVRMRAEGVSLSKTLMIAD